MLCLQQMKQTLEQLKKLQVFPTLTVRGLFPRYFLLRLWRQVYVDTYNIRSSSTSRTDNKISPDATLVRRIDYTQSRETSDLVHRSSDRNNWDLQVVSIEFFTNILSRRYWGKKPFLCDGKIFKLDFTQQSSVCHLTAERASGVPELSGKAVGWQTRDYWIRSHLRWYFCCWKFIAIYEESRWCQYWQLRLIGENV